MNPDIALDLAIKHTVEKYQAKTGISTKELANAIGIKSKAVFLNKVCPTNLANRFTDKQLILLQVATCDNTIARVMSQIVEMKLKEQGPTAKDITNLLLSVSFKNGELVQVVMDSIADGNVSRSEYEKTLKAINEKIAVLEDLLKALEPGQVRRLA